MQVTEDVRKWVTYSASNTLVCTTPRVRAKYVSVRGGRSRPTCAGIVIRGHTHEQLQASIRFFGHYRYFPGQWITVQGISEVKHVSNPQSVPEKVEPSLIHMKAWQGGADVRDEDDSHDSGGARLVAHEVHDSVWSELAFLAGADKVLDMRIGDVNLAQGCLTECADETTTKVRTHYVN